DLVPAADEERRALMQLGRVHVQNALMPVAGKPAGLLHDKRERIRLVEETQLPVRVPGIARIAKHATAEEVAMKIGDERPDVADAERLPCAPDAAVAPHELLHG